MQSQAQQDSGGGHPPLTQVSLSQIWRLLQGRGISQTGVCEVEADSFLQECEARRDSHDERPDEVEAGKGQRTAGLVLCPDEDAEVEVADEAACEGDRRTLHRSVLLHGPSEPHRENDDLIRR